MYLSSLSHNLDRNQESSWIDDPFGLKNQVKGVTMSHEKALLYFADDLVSQYAKFDGDNFYLSLTDLSSEDQNELALLMLESCDRETSECVHGNDFSIDNDYTCALLAMLKYDCKETRDHFAFITRKNILTYYANALQVILDRACDKYLHLSMEESGRYARVDDNQGDVVWAKFQGENNEIFYERPNYG